MSSDFSNLKKQAQYIDKAISDLNLKLAYPGSIFRPSRIPHTEEILEKLVSENEEICQSINEEKEIAEHNIQQLEKFLNEVSVDVRSIINEQRNIEEQLQQYGYTLMPETPSTLNEDDNNDVTENEHIGNDAVACEDQLEELSISSDAKMQDINSWNFTPRSAAPTEPLFSKYYYRALGLPVPPPVLNRTVNESCI